MVKTFTLAKDEYLTTPLAQREFYCKGALVTVPDQRSEQRGETPSIKVTEVATARVSEDGERNPILKRISK